MISCVYCDSYPEQDLLFCPFGSIFEEFVAAVFDTPFSVIIPDRFILTKTSINGYADEILLFDLDIIKPQYVSYFGHEIKIDAYKRIHKDAYKLLTDRIFANTFPPKICFFAHGIEIIPDVCM